MVRRTFVLATLTLLMAGVFAPAASAHTSIAVQIGAPVPIGAPVVVAPRPGPYGYVWQPGRYVWTRFGYQWVPGMWVRPAYAGAGSAWIGPRWDRDGRRWDRDDRYRDRDRHEWRDRDGGRDGWRR